VLNARDVVCDHLGERFRKPANAPTTLDEFAGS